MFARIKISMVILFSILLLGDLFIAPDVWARGFGGGGRAGGFDRGMDYGGRGGFGGDDSFGHIDRSYYGSPDAADRGTVTPMIDSGQMGARGDMAQHALATDGGFGRVMESSTARNLATGENHMTPEARGVSELHGDAVRNAYCHRDVFDAHWWAYHRGGWYYPWMNGYGWTSTGWPMLAGFWGMEAASYPVDYDYGNNITYQGNTVYYGSQPAATAAAYSQQAMNLAQSAPALTIPESAGAKLPEQYQKDWKPLGVFSLVQGGQTDSSKLFQLFVNKEGFIHGNYYDTMTNEVKPINGAIEKKSMRASWTINGVKDVIYDTGVANLLKPESPILIHFGKDKTQQWNLVRLEQSKEPDKTKES